MRVRRRGGRGKASKRGEGGEAGAGPLKKGGQYGLPLADLACLGARVMGFFSRALPVAAL